jgi:uncharacterized membrane protein YfcA
MSELYLLIILGFSVGSLGTLIGAGGGFIMVPALLILYPNLSAETLTGMSLAIVCANAVSGSIAYAYKRRIDYRSVVYFSIAAAPGAIIGSYLTSLIPRKNFEFGFGIVMILISLYLLFYKIKAASFLNAESKHPIRILTDREGNQHSISYSFNLGIIISTFVGFFSSLLGIGGGVIHVPALVGLLGFPVHIATATSHAILAIVSLLGVAEHIVRGDIDAVMRQVMWLIPAVVVGAQLGAHLSHKVKDSLIIKALAIGLLSVGLRFVFF